MKPSHRRNTVDVDGGVGVFYILKVTIELNGLFTVETKTMS